MGRWKKLAKLATIRRLPEAIRYGHVVNADVPNMHSDNAINKRFAYIDYTFEEDGKIITVQLDIKKSPHKNKFWVHKVLEIENVSDSPASTDTGTEAGQKITADNGIISQNSDSVNSKSSKKVEIFLAKPWRRTRKQNAPYKRNMFPKLNNGIVTADLTYRYSYVLPILEINF